VTAFVGTVAADDLARRRREAPAGTSRNGADAYGRRSQGPQGDGGGRDLK